MIWPRIMRYRRDANGNRPAVGRVPTLMTGIAATHPRSNPMAIRDEMSATSLAAVILSARSARFAYLSEDAERQFWRY